MGLVDFQTARTEIPLRSVAGKENSFSVRGLGLDDFSILITNHLSAITRAAEAYAQYRKDVVSTASLQGFVQVVIADFPGLMMEVISIAADEPNAKSIRLPLAVQAAALTEIARLTLEDAGGLGNLLAMLGAALKGLGGDELLASLKQASSQGSFGVFGKKLTS